MPEIGTSGLMSGEGKRSDWPSLKQPRPSSTSTDIEAQKSRWPDGSSFTHHGRADLLELSLGQRAGLDGFVTCSANGRPLDAQDFVAMVEMSSAARFGRTSGVASRTPGDGLIWSIHITFP